MENKKKIFMVVLSVLVCVMAIGYAVLSQQLNINGRASIDSTWKVEITNITEIDKVGDATSKEVPSYTSTTANFSVGLIQPGDSITYDIEISNLGTLKAKVDSINVVMDENNAITYTTSGIERGTTLGVNEKNYLTVTVAYNPTVTSQPTSTTKDLTVTINYVQDLGTNNEPSITYDTYSIGDQITFAGSNWYVIKNSTSEEDYVTLLKEKILTSEELGGYAANYNKVCNSYYIRSGLYGCKIEGETVNGVCDVMSYHVSDICHHDGYYGYTSYDDSGCEGHNDYERSKIKEFLEGQYINTLGSDKLKEVEGYKVRLITLEELQNNLGYATEMTYSWYEYNLESTPKWIYENFENESENSCMIEGYWTMTSDSISTSNVVSVSNKGNLNDNGMDKSVKSPTQGVRPVINLLKSSI